MKKVAHIAPLSAKAVTGPRNSVTLLAKHTNELGTLQSAVFTSAQENSFRFNDVEVKPLKALEALHDFDCVVFSSFFYPQHLRVARHLRRQGIPYVISPRSSLMREAFSRSRIKKVAFMLLGGRSYVKHARAVHFLTDDERKNSYAINDSSFVTPNISHFDNEMGQPVLSPKGISIGFMGRYDVYHKGLDKLVKAVALQAEALRSQQVRFCLAGPDFRGGHAQVEALIDEHHVRDLFALRDAVSGSEKLDFFRSLDAFIHTSRFEGQPQAVVEAMAFGLPVLVTPGTNMQTIVNASRSGVCLPDATSAMAESLRAACDDFSWIKPCGERAQSYARDYFAPEPVAESFSREILNIVDTNK
jgi:glycosyltransferase involved in cell wall biosynthesis